MRTSYYDLYAHKNSVIFSGARTYGTPDEIVKPILCSISGSFVGSLTHDLGSGFRVFSLVISLHQAAAAAADRISSKASFPKRNFLRKSQRFLCLLRNCAADEPIDLHITDKVVITACQRSPMYHCKGQMGRKKKNKQLRCDPQPKHGEGTQRACMSPGAILDP